MLETFLPPTHLPTDSFSIFKIPVETSTSPQNLECECPLCHSLLCVKILETKQFTKRL